MGGSQGQNKRKTTCYAHKVEEDSFLKGDGIRGSNRFFCIRLRAATPLEGWEWPKDFGVQFPFM